MRHHNVYQIYRHYKTFNNDTDSDTNASIVYCTPTNFPVVTKSIRTTFLLFAQAC